MPPRRGPRWSAAAVALVVGCGAKPGVPVGEWTVHEEPAGLELVREWPRPDLSPDTDWMSFPTEMVFDPATEHLFVQGRGLLRLRARPGSRGADSRS